MKLRKIEEITQRVELLMRDYPDFKCNIKLNTTRLGFNLTISGIDESQSDEIHRENLLLSKRYGFTQNIVGMEFETCVNGKNRTHKIVGFKTSNRKFPIITDELTSGQSYKFEASVVKTKLGGDSIINRNANIKKLFNDEK